MQRFYNFFLPILTVIIIFSTVIGVKTLVKVNKIAAANKTNIEKIKNLIELQDKKVQLAGLLKVYSVSDENGPLNFFRLGRDNDGGYVIPEKAIKLADVLLGYGIFDDISFEEQFSDKYNKPSYGFDCGVKTIETKNKLVTFIPECIASDTTLYGEQKSSMKVSSLDEQIDRLKLNGKKLFIKMDIEGAEYEAYKELINHKDDITGIVMEIHTFMHPNVEFDKAIKLLTDMQKNFLLVHVHGNNCASGDVTFATKNSYGRIPQALELTFINKNLVTDYETSTNQSHPTSLDMPNNKNAEDSTFEILLN